MAKARVLRGTYLVEFFDGSKYVFGNNYKWWWYHAIELAMSRHRDIPRDKVFVSVQYSDTQFVDDGGLKYCAADIYQSDVIDEVAKTTGKALKPFNEYVFVNAPKELQRLDKEFTAW